MKIHKYKGQIWPKSYQALWLGLFSAKKYHEHHYMKKTIFLIVYRMYFIFVDVLYSEFYFLVSVSYVNIGPEYVLTQ